MYAMQCGQSCELKTKSDHQRLFEWKIFRLPLNMNWIEMLSLEADKDRKGEVRLG